MPRANKRKILIVDDEEDFARTLAFRLSATPDFQVQTAFDGLEGFEKCLAFAPDAVLCDVAMPKWDGWEFCRRVRANAAVAKTPVVIVTAWLSEDTSRLAREVGATRLVLKPFDEEELTGLLRSLTGLPAGAPGMSARGGAP